MCLINEAVFEKIDSKQKAYWLGFIYADGNVSTKGSRIGFHLAYKDVILLEKFCDFVGGDRSRIVSYDDNKTVYYYIYSSKIKEDLASSEDITFSKDDIALSTCIACGGIISKSATRCEKCSASENNISNIKFEVSKEELETLINEKPMTEIGKMFGVSDNAIKKRCNKLGIELKSMRGHWAKVKAGKI